MVARIGAAIIGLVSVFVVSSMLISTLRGAAPGSATDGYWAAQADAVEANSFSSLAQMKNASDLILVATIERADISRQWQAIEGWGEDGVATYVMLHLAPDEVLSGTPERQPDGTVALEVFAETPGKAEAMLRAPFPSERVLIFAEQQSEVPGAYMLVSSQGLIRDLGGVAAPAVTEEAWLAELADSTFNDVLALVRALPSEVR